MSRQGVYWEEPLIFERQGTNKQGFAVPAVGVPAPDVESCIPPSLLRESIPNMPNLSEFEVVRHFNRLSHWNYCIDRGLYPLGSCTMKYNPRVNESVAQLPGFYDLHPYLPESWVQGALRIIHELEEFLKIITAMDAVTLQPAAGAHGELTGLLIIRAYLDDRGERRKRILVPDSAHGTNPASAALAGYEVVQLSSDERGCLSPKTLREAMNEDVAALMVTNPNTLGLFEEDILELSQIIHEKGGLLYMDGANFNALTGIAFPAAMGVDVLHLNLHKTFSTPHGGGGPGSGPVAVRKFLEPFLPIPRLIKNDQGYTWNFDYPKSIGHVKGYYGHFGVFIRALAYILSFGREHLREIALNAVLNANYLRVRLKPYYHLPYDRPVMHEVVFSDRKQKEYGVSTLDIAKRLMDFGFHPPTVYFPLIVAGALMIEPTECESKEEIDRFIDALKMIAEEAKTSPDTLKKAPQATFMHRFDEVDAARHPVLRWQPQGKEEPKF